MLVSIITPTYNCIDYLKKAIESVELQNIDDYELVVVDDNSTDDTWEWLESKKETLPNLRTFKTDGWGPAKARNFAVEQAKADLVAFLDADDIWSSDKLKPQVDFHLKNKNVGLSFTNYIQVDTSNKKLGTCFEFWPYFMKYMRSQHNAYAVVENGLARLFAENIIATSSVVARRDLVLEVGGFDTLLSSAEDWDLWLKIAKVSDIACTPSVGVTYLMHRPGAESNKHTKRLESLAEIMRRHRKEAFHRGKLEVARGYGNLMMARGEYHRLSNSNLYAFAYQWAGMTLAPSQRALRSSLSVTKEVIFPFKKKLR